MPNSTIRRDIRPIWLIVGAIALWSVICAVGMLIAYALMGCAGASGHARSGGTELGTTIIEPEREKVTVETFGRALTADELAAMPWAKKPEKTSK